jgi:peptide/nickel transport system substrate-binding protein
MNLTIGSRAARLFPVVLAMLALTGCFSDTEDEKVEFVLGDLIEPFEPPTFEDLNAKVEWIDQPVDDSMDRLRKRQAGEQLLATVDEALLLRNTSPENNAKILSALGRLPADPSDIKDDATITRHSAADVKSTNPILGSSVVEFDVSGLTSFGLIGFDWNFNPFASSDTVVSWQSSKDGMYDKIVLRDDLAWSDGKPITAHDVAFSFKVIMSEKVPVPAQRTGTDLLKWVEAYDDHTVVFFHKKALAINMWNISFSVLPKHIYEESIYDDPMLSSSDYHVALENKPVSGGPYVISKRTRNQDIYLERREGWYMHNGKQVRHKPHFKQIRFRIIKEPSVSLLALKAGDLDEYQLNPVQWSTQTNGDDFYKNNTKAFGLEWVFYYFGWNCKSPFFSDRRVRTAMSYAYDHDEMLLTLRSGLDEACNGIYHRTSRWAPKNPPAPYKRDLEKAEALLDEAGWTDHDGDGIRDKEINGTWRKFEFSILVMNKPERIAICNLLKENLSDIGILCNVKPLEFTVLQDKTRKHEFQAIFGGWGTAAYPDASENLWMTDKDRNFCEYSNPEVDQLFVQARSELSDEKRQEIFGKIHLLLYEDQPYTWLYFRNAYYGFNRSLRGYNFSPRGPYTYGPGFDAIWKPVAQ